MIELPRRAHDERGMYVVLFALVVTALFGMVAIVIDLQALRSDRTASRRTTDAAATAGAWALAEGTAIAACEDAWDYFLENTSDEEPVVSEPACDSVFSTTCVPTTARVATGLASGYIVEMVHPVPDGHELMAPNAIGSPSQSVTSRDGAPCERFGVRIEHTRDHAFARVIGFDQATTSSHSVARVAIGGNAGSPVNLLLLDKQGCGSPYRPPDVPPEEPDWDYAALGARGNAVVNIKPVGSAPGRIVIDSDGTSSETCVLEHRVIDAFGTNPRICAGVVDPSTKVCTTGPTLGMIELFAMVDGQTTCVNEPAPGFRACDPNDVSSGRLAPQPLRAEERTNRTAVDHRYNCKASYADLETTYPPHNGGTWDVEPCDDGGGAHIDDVKAALGTIATGPSNFKQWTLGSDQLPASGDEQDCIVASGEVVTVTGNWWIDCPAGFVVEGEMTIEAGNVVIENGVHVRSAGKFNVNTANSVPLPSTCTTTICADVAGSDGAIMFIRAGNLLKDGQAGVNFDNVAVYQEGGYTYMAGGGSGSIRWIAPLGGPLEDLLLWNETKSAAEEDFKLAGQGQLEIEGVLFTPRAMPFNVEGQGDQNQHKAQFITWNLDVAGLGVVTMEPDPDRVVLFEKLQIFLIR